LFSPQDVYGIVNGKAGIKFAGREVNLREKSGEREREREREGCTNLGLGEVLQLIIYTAF